MNEKMNIDKKKFAAVTAAAVSMTLVILLIVCGVFTTAAIIRNMKTIRNYQSSLEKAVVLETEVKDLYGEFSHSAEKLTESVQQLNFSQSLIEIEKLKGILDKLPDKIETLSEISGEDYSFLLDLLPQEKLKSQLLEITTDNFWELLTSDKLLKTLVDIFSESGTAAMESNIKEALERLSALNLTGTLRDNIESAKVNAITNALLLAAEVVVSAVLLFTAIFFLKKSVRNPNNI